MLEAAKLDDPSDLPEELAESVARLGKPAAVYCISPRYVSRKLLYGILLVAAGLIGNYLYWIVFNGPMVAEHLLFFLLISPIVTGIGLAYSAWRDRGLWALIFPTGLLRWQRGDLNAFPWDDSVQLYFYRILACEPLQREHDDQGGLTAWLPVLRTGAFTLGSQLVLRRADHVEAVFPSSLDRFDELNRTVQEETFRVLWPAVQAKLEEGSIVEFGEFAASAEGIQHGEKTLPWDDVETVLFVNAKAVIRSRRQRKPWTEAPLHAVMNPHVFAMLALTRPARAE